MLIFKGFCLEVIPLKGNVLFCDPVSFTGSDGVSVSGFRVCVSWTSFHGEHHVAEIWSRKPFDIGSLCRVVFSHKLNKRFVFAYENE